MPRLRRGLVASRPVTPLADRLAPHVDTAFRAMLDPDRIDALAEDLGAIKRRRSLHAGLAACAWILSAFERGTDTEGRQLDAHRIYDQLGGVPAGRTAWRDLTLKLRPVLRELLSRATRRWLERAPKALRGRLAAFSDILVPDGCAFKLASALSGVYKGTGQPAEFKLHAIYSVGHGSLARLATSAGAVHDSDGLANGPWQRDALYLWDLGYNDYGRFIDAARAGSHVVQRLKDKANPIVLASYGPTGARRAITDADGAPSHLGDACALGMVHKRQVLDLDVELTASGGRKLVARVVCVPCNGIERWYLSTLPRAIFSAHDVAEIYRVRWEVELYFRNWRGALRLDEVRKLRDPVALDVAIVSSLLASLLGHEIHDALERLAAEMPPAPPEASDDEAFPPCGAGATRPSQASILRGSARRSAAGRRRLTAVRPTSEPEEDPVAPRRAPA